MPDQRLAVLLSQTLATRDSELWKHRIGHPGLLLRLRRVHPDSTPPWVSSPFGPAPIITHNDELFGTGNMCLDRTATDGHAGGYRGRLHWKRSATDSYCQWIPTQHYRSLPATSAAPGTCRLSSDLSSDIKFFILAQWVDAIQFRQTGALSSVEE